MQEAIGPRQAGFFVLNAVLGVGVLSIAQETTRAAGTGSWVSVLLAGLLATGAAWWVARLSRLFPGQTIVGYASLLWGAWAGRIVGILYALHFLSLAGLVLRTFAEFSAVFLLPRTPLAVTVVAMLAVVAYAGHLRLSSFAALSALLAGLTILPMVLLLLIALNQLEVDLLLPVLSSGWVGVLKGFRPAIFSYLGFEIVLFVGAFVQNPSVLARWSALMVATAALLYTGSVVVSVGLFGPGFVTAQRWPLMSVTGAVTVPGEIVERPEVLIAALWVMVAFAVLGVVYSSLCA